MYGFVFLTMVFLSALSASAGPIENLFVVEPLPVEMHEMQMNASFLGVLARAKAKQAFDHRSKHQLVVTGDDVSTGPQLVNVGGFVVEPGARLPVGLREIIITGNQTKQIIVTNGKK
jgi:hypothetical protein